MAAAERGALAQTQIFVTKSESHQTPLIRFQSDLLLRLMEDDGPPPEGISSSERECGCLAAAVGGSFPAENRTLGSSLHAAGHQPPPP